MRDKILVVGGYGHVGQSICRELGDQFPGRVIAAGRNYKKAEKFTETTDRKVIPLELDIVNQDSYNILEEVLLVVMCLDQENMNFIENCLERGINYIDITADYDILEKIETFDEKAKESGATAVLSVGLSPGLTNLMVKESKSKFDYLIAVDIFLLLGLGSEHGRAAIEWMFDNMNTKFEVMENGQYKKVKSFEDGKSIIFPGDLGKKTAYRFDFAEQHVLPETLNIETVSHRLCFESQIITDFIALLKKNGIMNLLKFQFFKNIIIAGFEKLSMGSDIFAAKVVASGKRDGKPGIYESSIIGENQTKITARVATIIAKYIYTKEYLSGVYHIEQLFNLEEIMAPLKEEIKFYSKED